MLSSKLFSLLTFAAAAVARGIPKGQFFIANVESELVLAAEGGVGGSSPHALIALAVRDPDDNAQIWTSTESDPGVLTNEASQLVLEVPTQDDGEVRYGTELQVAERRAHLSHDFTQMWGYDVAGPQVLFTLANEFTVEIHQRLRPDLLFCVDTMTATAETPFVDSPPRLMVTI
ncbi:hypothetical protein AGABI1DRAFT_132651 [Agaricus bisporus var. burnettii JB137-S8]|uniref:Uncharacterized protein n=1 Tax=Agaricus bisporus var. burnettii (strain JB137-S8 / ATCC MYA-4627 / FGSC 10392) TaxID=597362 RepID=K5WWS4_AGABU|nr:uncharacterized protein AGABI1DRAFT_132651 [Agaricus bisporus var. burnettii JB137-S8]EKM75032.1 hypothetical protein AGABI1DRAFT_132651 [Agaricus bisporus var. burnettii JB137-S8]